MVGKFATGLMLIVLITGLLLSTSQHQIDTFNGKIWYVGPPPSDFTTIQEAIDSELVSDGDVIEVKWKSQPYYENVTVYKYLTIRRYSFDPPGYYPTIDGKNKRGIVFNVTSSDVEISGLIIKNGKYGIYLHCNGAKIFNNTIASNIDGVFIYRSNNCTLLNNKLNGNARNFGVVGSILDHFIHNIDNSNVIDGKPIRYLVNCHNIQVPENAGYVAVVNSTEITVKKLTLANNYQGVLIAYSNNITVENFSYAVQDEIVGIQLINTTNSVVRNVTLIPRFKESWCSGVSLEYSINNLIYENKFLSLGAGIVLDHSNDNVLVCNNVFSNLIGIALESSNQNVIFHNNIENNTNQIFIHNSFDNRFDNDYEGNYWSDYVGKDENGDGIGDKPHGLDRCPLIERWSAYKEFKRPMKIEVRPDLTTQKVCTFSNSTLASFNFIKSMKRISLNATCGYSGFINITIPRNWLDGPFNVLIDNIPVNFSASVNATSSSLYITYKKGTHMIQIYGTELGNIQGDINGDGTVDIYDLVIVAIVYTSEEDG